VVVNSAPSADFTLANLTGRLLVARVHALRTRDDVDAYSKAIADRLKTMPSSPVLCADHRPVVIYPQVVADRLVELFVSMNTQLERIAIISARSNATLVLQLERLVREAKFPNRKVFYAPAEAERHLAASLGADEITRARSFLAEWPGAGPASSRR
jgi:hypothetical protein